MSELNLKMFEFISEVQTALIANAINLSIDENASTKRDIFSATATLIKMDEAFRAAGRIPTKMSAHEAACQFVGYLCENIRERSEKKECPEWLARY